MTQSLFDFIDNLPHPIPVNSFPFWDGCNWTLMTMPPNGLNTCQDVQSCIDCAYIGSILFSSDSSILINNCNLRLNPSAVDNFITASFDGTCSLTIGNLAPINLCPILDQISISFFDGINTLTFSNGDQINLVGLDGMRFLIQPGNNIAVGLPTGATDMQVLTWDAVNQVAYWNNNQCCAQTLNFDCQTMQLCLSGTNCVDLSCINTDNQQLSLNGDVLCISGGNCIDISSIDNQTLSLVVTATTYDISISNGNTISIPIPAIFDCTDVQDCMENIILGLQNQIDQLAADIAYLQTQI